MRPHELTVRGFRSYRDEVTFDFRGRHLIGIVGPIGAGKSTILDAMSFALFGRTSRVQRDTKSLIHQQSDSAHVQLVFEVGGVRWRSTRALKRKGQGQVKLERLNDDDATVETVTMDRPVKERIERILGMDFDTFGRSVLLAQNQFSEFLLASDTPRNAVLKGVFGYERFDAALVIAKQRVAAAEATAAALDVQAARVVEARAALADAEKEAAATASARDALVALLPRVRELDDTLVAARGEAEAADELAARVTRATEHSPATADVHEVLQRVEDAAALAAHADQALTRIDAEVKEAEAARVATAKAVDQLQGFNDLVARHDAHAGAVARSSAALERARQEEAAAETRILEAAAATEAAENARIEAETAEADARASVEAAEEALHIARHTDMAMTLRAELVSGEPCPVCGQAVASAPTVSKGPNLRRAEKERDAAGGRLRSATETREQASARAAQAGADVAAAHAERDRRGAAVAAAEGALRTDEAALATIKSALVDGLGAGDPKTLLEERKAERDEAELAAQAAMAAAAEARRQRDAARVDEAAATKGVASLRERLVAAWGSLDERAPLPLTDDAASLTVAEALVRTELERRSAEAADARRRAVAEIEAATAARNSLLIAAELPPDADVLALVTKAEVKAATAEEHSRGLAAKVAEGADLDARIAAERAQLTLLRRLRDDLQPSRFLHWLLAEDRAALAELASAHLQDLTDGDFRFTDDESFRIVDESGGGAERDPDSLSGGETFLASLALALALADMVTRGGGRLDAFFLDEGFGSLDPEHIELAMAGIEHLVGEGGGDRLVILVSHVQQMHDLLEDLIVLQKNEHDGTSHVLAGAVPA